MSSANDKKLPFSSGLSLLLACASWIMLAWTLPAAFASALLFGSTAVFLGFTGYRDALGNAKKFRAAFGSLTGATSGVVTSLLAVLIWILVWPDVAERRAQQERAHGLLAAITTQTPASTATAVPDFSKRGGVYPEMVTVALTGEGTNSLVCYTTDGSEPSPQSEIYTTPIPVNRTVTVKAKSFRPGFLPSETVSQTYVVGDKDMAEFSSNLPLVVINTHGRHIMREPKTKVSAHFINVANGRSRISNAADYSGPAQMNLRGSSTLRFPKRSFSLTTGSGPEDKQKVSIFGLPKDSDFVLYAPYQDKTLMRDVLAYELSRNMGHYSVRAKFVELFMNTSGGKLSRGDYMGVYVLVEKIKRGKNRVNIEELTKEDKTEPNITGGYIFKRDHNDRNENGFYTRYGGPYYFVYPNDRTVTAAQRQWLKNYMDRFESALNGRDFMDPEKGYRAYLDVDTFIDQHWLIEMSKNVDGFRYSAYFNKDRGGKLKTEPCWDWNLSFGNADFYGGSSTTQWYYTRLRNTEISWYRRLRQDPEFMQRCVDRWGQLRANEFSTDRILKRVDEMASQLNEAQARNFKRWDILGERVHANAYVGRTYRDEVNFLKRFIKDRIAWMDSQMISAPRVSVRQMASERAVILEGSGGTIYYTLDGTDPRRPGGTVSPKAIVYTKPIPLSGKIQIYARSFQSTAWSSPTTLETAASVQSASIQ